MPEGALGQLGRLLVVVLAMPGLLLGLAPALDDIPRLPPKNPHDLHNLLQRWGLASFRSQRSLPRDTTQIHKKMTKDANCEGLSQQSREDHISRRNGQGPEHLKFFLLVFLNI